jgi:predicted transposase YdaD
MRSQLHEVLVAMVRENEDLTRFIAKRATGHPLPESTQLRTRDQSYSELAPPEYRADLVVELVPEGSDRPASMLVFEVQLARDPSKRYTWPAYQAVLRAQYRAPTTVVVLAPDPQVARWCANSILLDDKGASIMRPTVVGPDVVPVVLDPQEAEQHPALSVLSVIAHGTTTHALALGRAALHAASALDESDSTLYADLILHHLDAAARQALEHERMALKLKNKYEYQSPTFRRVLAEGKIEGKLEGKLESLEVILQARGFHLDEATRSRLQSYDAAELDTLVVRATTIENLDELFED